jgi:hypothetical protein
MAAILLNTVCMCLEHFEGSPVEVRPLERLAQKSPSNPEKEPY